MYRQIRAGLRVGSQVEGRCTARFSSDDSSVQVIFLARPHFLQNLNSTLDVEAITLSWITELVLQSSSTVRYSELN
jgi:hypothetical protein